MQDAIFSCVQGYQLLGMRASVKLLSGQTAWPSINSFPQTLLSAVICTVSQNTVIHKLGNSRSRNVDLLDMYRIE